MLNRNKKNLGELLVEAGIISVEQLETAMQKQKDTGRKLNEILMKDGLASEQQIMEIMEFQFKIPIFDFTTTSIDYNIPRLISENLARRHTVIPVQREGNNLIVAMADPMNLYSIDDINIATGLVVKPVIASRKEILNAIEQYYGKESAEKAVMEFSREYDVEQFNEIETDELNEINNAPVVRLVNSIIKHAFKVKASDIHIEPFEKNLRIRFRIDGQLQEIMNSSKNAHSAIVTRIKIMGKMDIAEKRIPQDGRVELQVDNRDIDLRISILPTVYGEKIVIRILDRSSVILSKSQLGFTPKNIELFNRIILNPNGIILVTGPTGSGKSTTLYAVLRELNNDNRNIITVEDPVEYHLEGINQVQVNYKAGLTFASGLRSILRQDPDIIMIGEIRDVETAQIAVRAAITGHLVLSTIHTNDSASTISRLVDMGIEPYMVSSSVVGIVAQRLVRKICEYCKNIYIPSKSETDLLRLKENKVLYRGEGCSMCSKTGYKGRTSIHEVMVINREIRDLINRHASADELKAASAAYGTTSLMENCIKLVIEGITTVDELIRVTYSID
jgi:type IV pilus assembly protein PilB